MLHMCMLNLFMLHVLCVHCVFWIVVALRAREIENVMALEGKAYGNIKAQESTAMTIW